MTPCPALALSLLLLSAAAAQAQCGGTPAGAARVAGIAEGPALRLQDGREIVLSGLAAEAERPRARRFLEERLSNREIRLSALSAAPDRYGRHSAYAFADKEQIPLQETLLRAGLARMSGRVDDPACRAALLAAEQAARAAKLGLWGDPVYDFVQAGAPAALRAERGRFAVVEGKVVSVRESAGTIYINFGRRWSEDFTATIPKRLERKLSSAGLRPRALAGRMVRVRGIVEERGGPWIEVTHAGQIEIAQH
jgi:endonuclease YncB( thermonuclease family)